MSTPEQDRLDAPNVVDNANKHRYEIEVDGAVAGFIDYQRDDARIVMPHTEVDSEYQGQGLASQLAKAALDDAREQGLRVVPTCPFIADYIEKHPEYADLVD